MAGTDIDYAARVAKGAALLDEKKPGWENQIALDTLNISDGTCCVTAQLSGVGSWITGMNQLGLSMDAYVATASTPVRTTTKPTRMTRPTCSGRT
ncbi:hypothetical protein [Streptomyces enissocaesilis]|uniref:Uncharacterized protein n=1 Tax=Streptomyces enissocaesilis TaxID=332589 RepID=A0ABP6JN59_9ACTN